MFGGAESTSYETALVAAPNAVNNFLDQFSTLTESFWFYNNTIELRFDTKEHKYFRVAELGNLVEQKGVTKTCHIIDRSVVLTPWAAKKVVEKLLRTVPLSEVKDEFGSLMLAPMTVEDFTKLAMEAKTAPKDILEEAGDIGKIAHACLEASIQHAIDNTEGVVEKLAYTPDNEKAASCAQAAFLWMQLHKVRWIKTEQKIYSREYEYAGTMDGLAHVSACNDRSCCPEQFEDRLSLIDWKSSNYLYIEYLFQTAAYQHAEQEEYGVNIQDRWILRLGKNEDEAGKFEPWHIPPQDFIEDFSGFLACLNLTKMVESVDTRMSTQKKGIRSIKKEMRAEAKVKAKAEAKEQRAAERAKKKEERAAEKARIKADAKAARELANIKGNKFYPDVVEPVVHTFEPEPLPAEVAVVFEQSVAQNQEPQEEPVEFKPFEIPMEG